MYCTNCLGQVHEVGYDVSPDHDETQFSDCFCGKISAIVTPFNGDEHILFVGLALTPSEKALYGNTEVD